MSPATTTGCFEELKIGEDMTEVDHLGKSWRIGCKKVKIGDEKISGMVAIGKWEIMGSISFFFK